MHTQQPPRLKIKVHPPSITPQFTPIGLGNPRYNSMLPYHPGVLLCVGSHLRWIDLEENKIKFDRQIGYCQIFEIMSNGEYIVVVNYDGRVTLLQYETLEEIRWFYAPGKQIRHIAFNKQYLVLAVELLNDTQEGLLLVYRVQDIVKGKIEPIHTIKGRHYFPQLVQNNLTVLQYHDPNPKGRKRKQTVMTQKLPITNQIVTFNLNQQNSELTATFKQTLKEEGQIICCCSNQGIIYYLHSNKKITIARGEQVVVVEVGGKMFPHVIQPYKEGVVVVVENMKMEYVTYDFKENKANKESIQVKSSAVGGNLALKFTKTGIYSFNESGLHCYNLDSSKTISKSIFSITNCGLSFSPDSSMLAVADFSGSFFIFPSKYSHQNYAFSIDIQPLFSVCIGIPIRTLTWCSQSNTVWLGCVGGGLYRWQFGQIQAQLVFQIEHTINIVRAVQGKIYAGTSDGMVYIFKGETTAQIGHFQAHTPIVYDKQEERELFGSMHNYAEIWSLAIPTHHKSQYIVTSCEDQTEKVFKYDLENHKAELLHHLKGHELAVTSVDWQIMDQSVGGELYVSCSDDKIIRFRDPKQQFKILFQIQTSTIKEWHTLTYLALEPKGTRVAVGSQNGYLFVYDIRKKQLVFGEKIHLGGIEGLEWKEGRICTCSSDLIVNVIEL